MSQAAATIAGAVAVDHRSTKMLFQCLKSKWERTKRKMEFSQNTQSCFLNIYFRQVQVNTEVYTSVQKISETNRRNYGLEKERKITISVFSLPHSHALCLPFPSTSSPTFPSSDFFNKDGWDEVVNKNIILVSLPVMGLGRLG